MESNNMIKEITGFFLGKWSNKITLYKIIGYIIISYFKLLEYFLGDKFDKTSIINLAVLFTIIILLVIYWNISTNRIPIFFNNKLKVAILVNIDNNGVEERVNNIFEDIFNELNSSINDDVHLIKLEINLIKDEKSIKKFLDKSGNNIDTLLWFKLTSGNVLNENISYEKMTVDDLRVFSRIPIEKNIRLFSKEINLIKDIQFSNFHKNWEYIEANSKIDKKKYKVNLSDIILQYVSIYYIYIGEFEKSLRYLTLVQNNKLEEIVNKHKNVYKLKKFNQIIIDLFFKVCSKYYFEVKDYVKCLELLNNASKLISEKSELYFDLNVNLAIVSYRNGLLDKAIHYSEILKKIAPISSITLLNFGFFAIIKNEPENLYKNYKNLKLRYKSINETDMLEVLSFLCDEQIKFTENENKLLFDFAIGFITINYIDYDEGLGVINDFIDNYSNKEDHSTNLLDLASSCIKRRISA